MRKFIYITLVLLLAHQTTLLLALEGDKRASYKQAPSYMATIIPASVMTIGILLNGSTLEKNLQKSITGWVGEGYHFPIDDYIQYAPIVEIYGADLLKVEARNHWFNQTKYLLFSQLISASIVHITKNLTGKTRPDGTPRAFPSGHTTFAFTNAAVLHKEFQRTAPLLAYSGFAFASTTGVFRLLNNRHWLSDVVTGMGLAFLTTELVYAIEPLRNWNPFKKSLDITLLPRIDGEQYGLYFCYNF